MWAWLIVVGVWGIIVLALGAAFNQAWLAVLGAIVCGAVLVVGAIYGSYAFLVWMQAPPFVPQ